MMHPLTSRRFQRHSHKTAAKPIYASDTDLRQPIQDYMTRIIIQWQDQFGRWHRFQEKHNQADAYRTAAARARSTGRRHRLVDECGQVLDVVGP